MTKTPHQSLYRVPVKGGILAPAELLRIIELARTLGQDGFHFGSRQDILLSCPPISPEVLGRFADLEPELLQTSEHANIVCSYVCADIFAKTAWLTSSTYLYILEQFNYSPKLEINITDPRQRLTPLFGGHLNFIASEREDFWYLYVRLPGWKEMVQFPAIIHGWDLAKVARSLEQADGLGAIEDVVIAANEGNDLQLRNIEKPLSIPFYPFPFYEGMNRLDAGHYWLGLYWRNNWYDLDFLEATCQLCLDQRIGKICITTWKSFIISGLPADRRIEWEKLLGRFGINARHSSVELNWHIPVGDDDALNLKRYLVRAFDQRDISTYGLTFGVGSDYSRPFTSIVIDPERAAGVIDGYAVRPTYNLRYARNFDPNTLEYVEYARQVDRSELVELITELSRLYFEQLNEGPEEVISGKGRPEPVVDTLRVWQCGACLSVYDPALGDAEQGVPPGTGKDDLPAEYVCATCGAAKELLEGYVLTINAVE